MLKIRQPFLAAVAALLFTAVFSSADACTRAVYLGAGDTVLTARSMDWRVDMKTNLWAFPRGMQRDGQTPENPLRWTSKYGSVVATAFDIATTDGINEKGLSANLLWLNETQYPEANGRSGVSIALWAQYVLDNFATVREVVEAMQREEFFIFTGPLPGEEGPAVLHLSVSDASGDSAILEYLDGELVVHHDRSYQVMTNSPVYSEQLALNQKRKSLDGQVTLPGSHRSTDRFARTSHYIDALPEIADTDTAVASVFSVIRNASVPMGISTPDQPNIAATLWRSVADHKNRVYYFESVRSPNIFHVDLKALDLSPGAPTRKLVLTGGQVYAGEVSAEFKSAKPFKIR